MGTAFSSIALSDYVYDLYTEPADMTWNVSGNEYIDITIDEAVLNAQPNNQEWIGTETIQIEACNPGGKCVSTEVSFSVYGNSEYGLIHVSNAGFIIMAEGKKILLDALLGGDGFPSPELAEVMTEGTPPFDDVDLILVTHYHFDHFDSALVASHLMNNPKVQLASTTEVVEMLQEEIDDFSQIADQVTAIELTRGESAQFDIAGIEFEAFYISHDRPNLTNLGYLIQIGELTFFHTGDPIPANMEGAQEGISLEELQDYGLPEKDIDVAFIPRFLFQDAFRDFVLQGIPAKQYIPMHLYINCSYSQVAPSFEEIATNFPRVTFFPGEMSWVPLELQDFQ
jgi:L-ascorbate metabolism protein UlaG (beta-lactamase superfamily)